MALFMHPQSALSKMQNHFTRSNLELRGPRNGLEYWSPKLPRGVFGVVSRADPESPHERGA
eukprot:13522197-Alexandrium_andersonii.AAC.1